VFWLAPEEIDARRDNAVGDGNRPDPARTCLLEEEALEVGDERRKGLGT
jgi:hypothetical protein